MGDKIDEKVREALAAIEREKKEVAAEKLAALRPFLAFLGVLVGGWLHSSIKPSEPLSWILYVGIGGFLGFFFEIPLSLIWILIILYLFFK